jgi:hypothetical protein
VHKTDRALVTLLAANALQAGAYPSGRVALGVVWVDTRRVATAWNALHLRISPHIRLALIALSPTVSNLAFTLAKESIA